MAKPNYNFEKRQRDIAKQKKQEEKRQKKLARKADGSVDSDSADGDEDAATADDVTAPSER